MGSSTNTAEAINRTISRLPSKHKTTRSPIKQEKAQISFVGCQQCTIYISEELTQNEADKTRQVKASLR